MILLESSALIEASRRQGRADIRSRVKNAILSGQAALCAPVYFELSTGAIGKKELNYLRELRSTLFYLDCIEKDWENATQLALKLRQAGKTIRGLDILIYCIALRHKADILTLDKDFKVIAEYSK